MSQVERYGRAMTVEEYRSLEPLTGEQRAQDVAAMREILDQVRREHESFVANGGHVMTNDEWQSWWESLDDDDDDCGNGPAAK